MNEHVCGACLWPIAPILTYPWGNEAAPVRSWRHVPATELLLCEGELRELRALDEHVRTLDVICAERGPIEP